jgi:hypothetical protein
VNYVDRLRRLPLEKKLLVPFFAICLILTFSVIQSPGDIGRHYLPLFLYFHVEVGDLLASGRPLWQVALACFGVSSIQLLLFWYFGGFGIRTLLEKLISRSGERLKIPFEKVLFLIKKKGFFGSRFFFLKKNRVYQRLSSLVKKTRERFTGWLKKQNLWIILFFLFLPLPFTDIAAAAALGTRKMKYGHWYLMAVNLPHIFLVVALIHWGVNLFFF